MSQTRLDRALDLSGFSQLDLEKSKVAKVHDYFPGEAHTFAVARESAEQTIVLVPEMLWIMRTNRVYPHRVGQCLVQVSIRQVICVDNDPVPVAHSSQILTVRQNAVVVRADIRELEKIFDHPDVHRLVDPAEPVGVLMFAVLHFVSDSDDPCGVIARYRHHMLPDSHIALSHAACREGDESMADHRKMYDRSSNPMTRRTMDEVMALMDGFETVPPGVVYMPLRRRDSAEIGLVQPERSSGYAAAGRVA